MRCHAILAATSFCLQQSGALALEAREIFKLAEPSIVVVLASDAKGEKSSLGSGVLIAPLDIVTSCKVVNGAADIVVTQGSALRPARLQFQDQERDLCQLHIEDPLPAGKPAARPGQAVPLAIGDDAFVVSAPQGTDRTLARAMVSDLQEVPGTLARLIGLDASFAPASSGGGVFDRDGRLVGTLTPLFKRAGTTSHAIPADWIAELAQRNQDRLLAADAAKAAPAPDAKMPATTLDERPAWMPRKGDRWTYKLFDQKRFVGNVEVEIAELRDNGVRERITRSDSRGFVAERTVEVSFGSNKFLDPVALPGGYQLFEFSPYFPPDTSLEVRKKLGDIPGRINVQPAGMKSMIWPARVVGRERVRVPAGEFDAWKIEAIGTTNTHYGNIKLTCHYWYATNMSRVVKIFMATDWGTSAISTSETYELAKFEKAP